MSKNNKSNTVSINKGMFAIIVILVALLAMFAIDVVAIYMSDTKTLTGKTDNTLSDSSKGNSSVCKSTIGLDDRIKLNSLIDNDLVALLYKEKLSDLTDLELRTLTRFIKYKEINVNVTNANEGTHNFTSDELKKVFNNSVFSELKYEDGNIGTYCAGVIDDTISYDYDKGTKTYNSNSESGIGAGCNVGRPYVYTYNVDSYMKGNKYVIVNKYLFGYYDPNLEIEEAKHLFGNVNDFTDYTSKYYSNDKIDATNSVVTLDNIGEEYLDMGLLDSSLNEFTKDYKNYDSIKDKLDTYTYTFEKKDGHFVITDFSVEHSK